MCIAVRIHQDPETLPAVSNARRELFRDRVEVIECLIEALVPGQGRSVPLQNNRDFNIGAL